MPGPPLHGEGLKSAIEDASRRTFPASLRRFKAKYTSSAFGEKTFRFGRAKFAFKKRLWALVQNRDEPRN
jgi:hypothetical protein